MGSCKAARQLHKPGLTGCDSIRSKMLSKLPLVVRLLWLAPGSSVASSSSEGPTLASSLLSRAVLAEPSLLLRPGPGTLPATLQVNESESVTELA